MDRIIIFGAGKMLQFYLPKLLKIDDVEIAEIWDTKIRNVNINNIDYIVKEPYKNADADMIFVTSDKFYDEIEESLMTKFAYSKKVIRNKSYFESKCKGVLKNRYAFDASKKDILIFWEQNELSIFNYDFVKKYDHENIKIFHDKEHKLFYCYWNDKKMYLSKAFETKLSAQKYVNSIKLEQDVQSPHYYNPKTTKNSNNKILIDAGVAEGFFALDYIDKVEKIYLIECDQNWLEALSLTFKDYMDKVVIIPKMVGDENTDDTITIDSIIKDEQLSILKLDVEGAERKALLGAKNSIKNSENFSAYICAYHKHGDEDFIAEYFKGYNIEACGYMFYMYGYDDNKIELRRGVMNVNNTCSLTEV